MAKHSTRKSNSKDQTIARKARRAVKYATTDFDALLSTLNRPLAVA